MAGWQFAIKMTAFASYLLASAPLLAQDLPGDVVSRYRNVHAGIKTKVWTSWALTPDCQVVRGFNVRVVRLPRHGTAALEKVEEVITPRWLSHAVPPDRLAIVRRCMGMTVTTIGVFYTAKSLHPGNDSLSIVITNAAQTRQRALEISITVQ